ncbi:Holliday junction branch migration protein RuvA [Crocinitomix catalasitica]|uniref:Holliday junction branch migration protein RuvA n=1 Tax=Crocinitomix catalasitica TaxID=184607 RepID=UPI000487323E|nr:Holliday junction branch migration protein RuvA [Crocinitomix catalasitica]
MITHLNGRLIEKTPTNIIVECNGVGYFVKISLNTFSQLGPEEQIKIYTQLQIREDAHTLYGFHTTTERIMFNLLISVSGIGANTAILMLSALTPSEIATGIVTDNVALIQSIKGIGAKTAQRVIIDLKDKVGNFDQNQENFIPINNTNENDALNALLSLGFDKPRAEKAIKKVATEGQTVEGLIKDALKVL